MIYCASDRSSHFSSIQVVRHPDRILAKHMDKIPSRGLFLRLCRSLSASTRTTLPICYSFRCGCATDRRPLTADFVWMQSPICVF